MGRTLENLEQFGIDVVLGRRRGFRASILRGILYALSFVYERLVRWLHRRGGQRATRWVRWTAEQFHGMGLYRLRGTVRYPAQAASVRSSVSRVRENRTHGLKGVC